MEVSADSLVSRTSNGMKIGILGYGEQGRSAYEYWNRDGNQITVLEQNEDIKLPPDVDKVIGDEHLKNLGRFDLIIRSPIVDPKEIVAANSIDILQKVTTVTDEFMRISPTKNIIAVTGTKGKGTTSTLIAKMLEAAGKKVHLAGNIGTPPLDLIKSGVKPEDYVVLELANFQLVDLKHSPHIAVCLMIVPEHMDWHESMQEYVSAKANIFAHQKSDDVAVYFAKNEYSKQIAATSLGRKTPYYQPPGAYVRDDGMIVIGEEETEVMPSSEVKLLGEHNLQNICAALTAVFEALGSIDKAETVLSSFSGLEHRLELVRSSEGIKYYDDSFGTTPETAIVAMQAFKEPKVLILGGSDKGVPFEPLADEVLKSNIRQVIAIGKTGARIAQLLRARGFTNIQEGLSNMPAIVAAARQVAQEGDVVLLSTGSASFDMFKNYKDRGEQFKQAVLALA